MIEEEVYLSILSILIQLRDQLLKPNKYPLGFSLVIQLLIILAEHRSANRHTFLFQPPASGAPSLSSPVSSPSAHLSIETLPPLPISLMSSPTQYSPSVSSPSQRSSSISLSPLSLSSAMAVPSTEKSPILPNFVRLSSDFSAPRSKLLSIETFRVTNNLILNQK
ncbi:unnamed protein product [Rotaria sp. Silwood2]|nr:unnamed protein product [Rotaria sp. Silwood2]